MNRSGKTATKRERDALADLIRLKKLKEVKNEHGYAGDTFGLPKSKGMTDEEYEAKIDALLDEIIEIQYGS